MTVECAPLDNVVRPGESNGPSGIALTDRRFVGQVNLRVRGSGLTAAGRALGYALPMTANTTAGDANSRACWLGPDEWLIVCNDGRQAADCPFRFRHLEKSVGYGRRCLLVCHSGSRAGRL